ncbi:MAG: sulfite exporter TauE/SafE family protein [Pseudomonadota bacterium]
MQWVRPVECDASRSGRSSLANGIAWGYAPAMEDWALHMVVGVTFLLAGTVKGVVGVGLPTVAVACLTLMIGLAEAIALTVLPALVTNIWQASVGGHGHFLLKRLWPFLLAAALTIGLGALVLSVADTRYLAILLGALLATYGAVSLAGCSIRISEARRTAMGVGLGLLNGALTGMTGAFNFPAVLYFQAIGLSRDQLIQAMGILFLLSSAVLGLALGGTGLFGGPLLSLSALAVLPTALGMMAGQVIRKRLSEARFRRLFFVTLVLLGPAIAARALVSLAAG